MKLMKCNKGHLFDGDIYSECPHCGNVTEIVSEVYPIPEIYPIKTAPKCLKNARRSVDDDKTYLGDSDLNETIIGDEVQQGSKEVYETEYFEEADELTEIENIELIRHTGSCIVEKNVVADNSHKPVVGWLVGLNGEAYGKDYKLVSGWNFIGKGSDMDIVLQVDADVCPQSYAAIIYDPKGRQFLIQPSESKEPFYMDDKIVVNTQVMREGCVLCIGRTKFKFITFCGKDFSWEMDLD